jgi:hypothetical protein
MRCILARAITWIQEFVQGGSITGFLATGGIEDRIANK